MQIYLKNDKKQNLYIFVNINVNIMEGETFKKITLNDTQIRFLLCLSQIDLPSEHDGNLGWLEQKQIRKIKDPFNVNYDSPLFRAGNNNIPKTANPLIDAGIIEKSEASKVDKYNRKSKCVVWRLVPSENIYSLITGYLDYFKFLKKKGHEDWHYVDFFEDSAYVKLVHKQMYEKPTEESYHEQLEIVLKLKRKLLSYNNITATDLEKEVYEDLKKVNKKDMGFTPIRNGAQNGFNTIWV